MVDNSTLPIILQPLSSTLTGMMMWVQLLVGGMFGIYVLMFIWRFYDARRTRRILKEIHKDIKSLQSQIRTLKRK